MRLLASIVAATLIVVPASWGIAAEIKYPMVFDSLDELKKLGIALAGIDENDSSGPFPNGCYYYGDGGWPVSISDALLSHYQSQGFFLESACLALVSGLRFNPETGRRLATYILVNSRERANLAKLGYQTDAAALSDELPLSLPNCFHRGLPYLDCVWNYDPLTGKKLSSKQTKQFKDIGARIERYLSDCQEEKVASDESEAENVDESSQQNEESEAMNPDEQSAEGESASTEESEDVPGLQKSGEFVDAEWENPTAEQVENAAIARSSAATFYACSSAFPTGHGYALYASGDAAPEVSAAIVKAALSGKEPPSQVDPAEIWGKGTD